MDSCRIVVSFGVVLLVFGQASAQTPQRPRAVSPSAQIVRSAGEYLAPNGRCKAVLATAAMGGFLVLTVTDRAHKVVKADDVSGMSWIGDATLVYTTSPIYGVPGLYRYHCGSKAEARIVAPKTMTEANPDGADYFELEGVSMGPPATIYFYYSPDVERTDFKKFRTREFLYQVRLDGTDLKHIE